MSKLLAGLYRLLGALACVALAAAFGLVALGVIVRQTGWDIQGLDGYAGYAIAAALFLALPATFQRGEHIRVTLGLERLPPKGRAALELWSLVAGLLLSAFMAFYAVRLVWVSYITHDVSPAMDATPLWIPQLAMALGCIGLALALLDALCSRWSGKLFFAAGAGEAARVE